MKKIKLLVLISALACSNMASALILKVADNHIREDSTVKALNIFAKNIAESTDGKIKAKVYANGVLGDEVQVLQQLQQGIIDIGRVSTASLSQFQPKYSLISMPYLFNDMDHFRRFAISSIGAQILESTNNDGIVGVTFYTNGFRSFYTKNKAITEPKDLNGLKIRVMGDPIAIEMTNLLGAKATPMAYSEVFSAIQQGVLDGAESAVTVLTNGSHGEVAKNFSFDEHSLLPDVVVVSRKTLAKLSDEEKEKVIVALKDSWKDQDRLFMEDLDTAYKVAKEKMGVQFNIVDKAPFRVLVQPMYDKLPADYKIVVEGIKGL